MAEAGLHITGVAGAATLGKHGEPASFDAKGELLSCLPHVDGRTVAHVQNSRRKKKVGDNGPCLLVYVYVPYLSTAKVPVMEGIVGIRGPQEKQ